MIHTPAATGVQLARAETLGKALTHRGWTSRREPQGKHPGAVAATVFGRPGICVLVLTLGGRHGQMIEITAEAATGHRGEGGRRVRTFKPSWRLTAYDPPVKAVLAAVSAACDEISEPGLPENDGWTVKHAPARKVGPSSSRVVRATRFTRLDHAVTATFHIPAYTPPCEHCTHHGELGDIGGWDIVGPGFTAEATAHTPAAVIGAFTRSLPGGDGTAATPCPPPGKPRHRVRTIPAATPRLKACLTAVVCG